MKILITGGTGFLGRNLCASLEGEALCTVGRREREGVHHLTQWTIDLRSKHATHDLLDGARFDVVIHAAGNPSIKDATVEDHVGPLLNVLSGLKKTKFIFISSAAVYGQGSGIHDEDSGLSPLSVYGAAKAACEYVCQAYEHKGWDISIVRPVAMVGPHATHGLLLDAIAKYKAGAMEMLGKFPGSRKPYLHVNDACEFIVGLVRGKYPSGTYNLSNSPLTVEQVVRMVLENRPQRVVTWSGSSWEGDQKELLVSSAKARTLGWAPMDSITAVKTAIKELWNNV